MVLAIAACGAPVSSNLFNPFTIGIPDGSDANNSNDSGAGDTLAMDRAPDGAGGDPTQDAVVGDSNPSQADAGGGGGFPDGAAREAGPGSCDPIFWCYGNDGGQAYCGRVQFQTTTCGVIDCGSCAPELTCAATHCHDAKCMPDDTIAAFCRANGRPDTMWGYVRNGPRACTSGYLDDIGRTLDANRLQHCAPVGNFFCCDYSS